MSKHYWPELYTGPWILGGNTAKIKVAHELQQRFFAGSPISILDVGVVGPRPFNFWEPLLESYSANFHLTGVDVRGIDRARQVVEEQGWGQHVALHQGSGYTLHELFAPDTFHLVVATQVIEHVARLPLFLQQIVRVMKSGGEGFFTIDSAHYQSRFDLRFPTRLAKNLVKKVLSLAGNEKHFDLPWMDDEIVKMCEHAGLEVVEYRYYNVDPIKFIHNHVIPNNQKNSFIKMWFDLEEIINDDRITSSKIKHLFMALYVHVAKP